MLTRMPSHRKNPTPSSSFIIERWRSTRTRSPSYYVNCSMQPTPTLQRNSMRRRWFCFKRRRGWLTYWISTNARRGMCIWSMSHITILLCAIKSWICWRSVRCIWRNRWLCYQRLHRQLLFIARTQSNPAWDKLNRNVNSNSNSVPSSPKPKTTQKPWSAQKNLRNWPINYSRTLSSCASST